MPDKRAPEMRFRSELYLGKKVTKIIKFIKNVDLVVPRRDRVLRRA